MEDSQQTQESKIVKQCPYCKTEISRTAKKCPQCGSRLGSWPVRHPLITAIGAIAVIFLVIMLAGASEEAQHKQSQQQNNSNAQNPVVVQGSQPAGCTTPSDAEKKSTKTIDYKLLDKDPDSFKGQFAKFTGQIVQIQENNGEGIIRLSVTKDAFGWSSNDIVYVIYHQHTTAVDNDIVMVFGTITGSETYTSEANFNITIPSLDACVIEKAGAPATTTSNSASPSPSASQTSSTPKQQTTASATPQTPPAPPATWHTAITYSNSVSIKTAPFAMKGTEWRITYQCTATDPTDSVNGFDGLISSSDANVVGGDTFALGVTCPSSNTSYSYDNQAGQYYLDLTSDNTSYTVTVEDYY